jgi:hypothetical protein
MLQESHQGQYGDIIVVVIVFDFVNVVVEMLLELLLTMVRMMRDAIMDKISQYL